MTIAVCIRCGARKHGALTPCGGCGFDPAENLDKARSMILTDHFLAETDLDGIGERIRTGLPVNYPEEAVAEYVAMFERGADKLPLFLRIGCVIAILAVVGVVAFVVIRGV
jgi:hypothetical protein